MTLDFLLKKLEYDIIQQTSVPFSGITVSDVIYDSRKVIPDALFVCIQGAARDSHDMISEVISNGSVVVVIDHDIPEAVIKGHPHVVFLQVKNSRIALAVLAAAYFDNPAEKLITIGITGTKGKTTTSYMVQSILEANGDKVGVIGTIGAVINGEKQKTINTTPESYELQRLFAEMVKAGCKYCVMEVSSQGLKLHRVAGFTFDIGVFTNFSADHIGPNEHASMEEYLYCKSLLFRQCKLGILNQDDPNYEGMVKDHLCELKTFGVQKDETECDFIAASTDAVEKKNFSANMNHTGKYDLIASHVLFRHEPGVLGMEFDTEGMMNQHVMISVPGMFSVYNALVAIAVGKSLSIPEDTILHALATIQVRGRVEIVPVCDRFTIMIDYAHNEASVESLLTTILEYRPKRIVCVYGGGGNRSKLRRYAMGELCGQMASLSILTCDNPRNEEIADINADIKVGLARSNGRYIEIEDRREAIRYSMDHAEEGDVIILLGKGHEDYQEIKGVKYHFSEREVIEEYRNEKELS